MVVLGEARELEDDQALAQPPLEGEARLRAELEPGARGEEVPEQPELVRLEVTGLQKRPFAALLPFPGASFGAQRLGPIRW